MLSAYLMCAVFWVPGMPGGGGTGLCKKWEVQLVAGNEGMCALVRDDDRRKGLVVSECFIPSKAN